MGKLTVKKKGKKLENMKQKQAFLAYYAMGDDRSLAKLVQETGHALCTLERWSSQFGWQNRIAQMDEKIHRAIVAKFGKEAVDARGKAIQVTNGIMNEFLARLQQGRVGQISVKEMTDVIKTAMLLHGGATQRTDHTGEVGVNVRPVSQRDKLEALRQQRGVYDHERSEWPIIDT